MNSGPLSERMYAGTPRRMNRSLRTSRALAELSFRSTWIARHSRLYSSRMFNVRNAYHHPCGNERSRRTRHGRDTQAATEHTIRHSTRAAPSSVVLSVLLAPRPPQALDTLVVDLPASVSQQRSNPTIAVSTVLAGQLDHIRNQSVSSARPLGSFRCVERCWSNTRQPRRSVTMNAART